MYNMMLLGVEASSALAVSCCNSSECILCYVCMAIHTYKCLAHICNERLPNSLHSYNMYTVLPRL